MTAGTYQMILAEVNYDCGVTLHVSAASRSASYDQIVALLQNVYPTGVTRRKRQNKKQQPFAGCCG